MNCTSKVGDVLFPTQWCGIESVGTAYRMDHVPIMLRKVVEPPPGVLNDEQILKKILDEVRLIKAQKAGITEKHIPTKIKPSNKAKTPQTVELHMKKPAKQKISS
jgi:hypothetical protein